MKNLAIPRNSTSFPNQIILTFLPESKGADAAKGSASKKKAPDVASATPKAATTNTNTNTNTTASKEKTKAKKKKEAPSSGKSKSKPAEPPTEKKRSKKVSKPTLKEAKAVAERRRSQHGFDPDRLSPQVRRKTEKKKDSDVGLWVCNPSFLFVCVCV